VAASGPFTAATMGTTWDSTMVVGVWSAAEEMTMKVAEVGVVVEGTDAATRRAERERSIFFRGYRYTLRDQDSTWPAAYESVRRWCIYDMIYRYGF